jgi:hypothetical protein
MCVERRSKERATADRCRRASHFESTRDVLATKQAPPRSSYNAGRRFGSLDEELTDAPGTVGPASTDRVNVGTDHATWPIEIAGKQIRAKSMYRPDEFRPDERCRVSRVHLLRVLDLGVTLIGEEYCGDQPGAY